MDTVLRSNPTPFALPFLMQVIRGAAGEVGDAVLLNCDARGDVEHPPLITVGALDVI